METQGTTQSSVAEDAARQVVVDALTRAVRALTLPPDPTRGQVRIAAVEANVYSTAVFEALAAAGFTVAARPHDLTADCWCAPVTERFDSHQGKWVRPVALTDGDRELIGEALGSLWLHPARRAEIAEMCQRTGIDAIVDDGGQP